MHRPPEHEQAACGDPTSEHAYRDPRPISAYRENFYVQNPINRFGLLPDMPKYNADGSLDVYLQATSPGRDKESNWLPTPRSGMFNLTIRIYDPKKEALDPAYRIPFVIKMEE